jgi:hypothetical protein
MGNPGAEKSLASAEAAKAYLARRDDQDFVRELLATWCVQSQPMEKPPASRAAERAKRHAAALLALLERYARLPASLQLNSSLRHFLHALESSRTSVAREYRRRLAAEPKRTRAALLCANCAFAYEGFLLGGRPRRVSGRLAAVMAVALGVEPRPGAAEGAAHRRVDAWEARMARASKTIAKMRRGDFGFD